MTQKSDSETRGSLAQSADALPPRLGALASGGVVLATGLLAWAFDAPLLAPPLGVTAVLCFRTPGALASKPRSIVLGHAVGVGAGLVALALVGGIHLPSVVDGGFTLRHALASSIAVLLTVLANDRLASPHPPAGATTLVVALGFLQGPRHLLAFGAGVLVTAFLATRGR